MSKTVNEFRHIYSLRVKNYREGSRNTGFAVMGISKETFESLKAQGAKCREYTCVVLALEPEYTSEHTIRQYLVQHEIIADEGKMTNY